MKFEALFLQGSKNYSTDCLEKYLIARVFCIPPRGPCSAVLWCGKPKSQQCSSYHSHPKYSDWFKI